MMRVAFAEGGNEWQCRPDQQKRERSLFEGGLRDVHMWVTLSSFTVAGVLAIVRVYETP